MEKSFILPSLSSQQSSSFCQPTQPLGGKPADPAKVK